MNNNHEFKKDQYVKISKDISLTKHKYGLVEEMKFMSTSKESYLIIDVTEESGIFVLDHGSGGSYQFDPLDLISTDIEIPNVKEFQFDLQNLIVEY